MNFQIKAMIAKDEKGFGIAWVISRGWSNVFIDLCFVDIEISLRAKDWMLRDSDGDVIVQGRTYQSYKKNPKYDNDKIFTFVFPSLNHSK